MTKTLCLIPAKGCSTRLPRKNVLPIDGQPLISRAIAKAIASQLFAEVCVSTEDEEIAQLARNGGAKVPFKRPEVLSRDPSTLVDVMLHALQFYSDQGDEFDTIFVTLPTSPFVSVDDFRTANRQFQQQPASVLMSVSATEFPPYNAFVISEDAASAGSLEPCFPDSPYKYIKSTECPPTFRSNGAILIVNAQQLMQHRSYRTFPLRPYVMPMERSIDIDTELEYRFAQFLANTDSNERSSDEELL